VTPDDLSDADKVRLRRLLWREKARPEQLPPDGWTTWLCRGGRGSGKTRAGAETLASLIVESPPGEGDWAVIAPTFGDARDVCIESEGGLLRCLAGYVQPGSSGWNRSQGQLHLVDGSTVFCDGADDGAYRMQGKNLRGVWCDEVGLWRRYRAKGSGRPWWEVAWDESIAFALRKDPAKIIATGTPKRGHPLVKRLLDDPLVASSQLRTIDNIRNLSKDRVDALLARFEGTTLAPQELEGVFLEDIEGALWVQRVIDDSRWQWDPPRMSRVYIGVDPSGGDSETSGETGIVAAGLIKGKCPCGERPDQAHYAVVGDCSLKASAMVRARAVVACFDTHSGDKVIGERNYGGDLVKALVEEAAKDGRVPFDYAHASRGKEIRAEPVASMYEQGRVHHVGVFHQLEDQLVTWSPDGGWSPDRLDALVWALTKLQTKRRSRVQRSSYVGRLPERLG